jgi:hypothetical protein
MKFKIALLFLLMALPGWSFAQALMLKPGETQTVSFDQLRYLEKGAVPSAAPRVTVRATITLQSDGKTLVVKFLHLAAAGSPAALYAFDLGLAEKDAVRMRANAKFTEFPAKANWMGPTDDAELTAGKGAFTFAARDAVMRDIAEFLRSAVPLPPGFLTAGQQGCITVQLVSEEIGKKPLRLSPMAYFLVPEPTMPALRRLRMAARMSNGNAP